MNLPVAVLVWLFIGGLFRPLLPEAEIESDIAGLILLGAAPCTAMVFVWSNLTKGEAHCIGAPSALIGASNFFELAVAAAISLFGLNSGAALGTVVGVLIEAPVMLSLVRIVNGSKGWYKKGLKPHA